MSHDAGAPLRAKEILRRYGWLSRCTPAFQDDVLARGHFLEFGPGDQVYGADDDPGGLIGICNGQAAVWAGSKTGVGRIAHILRAGHWFGAAALLVKEPRRVGISALSPVSAFVLPIREADAIIAKSDSRSEGWRPFARLVVENSDLAVGVARDLMIRNTRIRCIAVLLRLAGHRLVDGAKDGFPTIAIGQEDLAFLSGLSRNALGTVLRKLEQEGLISLEYRLIRINSLASIMGEMNRYEDGA